MLDRCLTLLVSVLCSSCYTIEQAYYFNNAYNSRVNVEEALSSPDIEPELRHKLLLSREVLKFAREQGLNTGGAYQHYIPEVATQVSYLVQAAHADRLVSVTWWFPFVGRVPYLGYFDRKQRDAEAESLRESGFDVTVGSVGAFSSLGWFDDPIYASMTKRDDADFVQMLLHELVHRSYWSSGSVVFNENLAEYLSQELTDTFLSRFLGGRGLDALKTQRQDQETIHLWLLTLKRALEEIYNHKTMDRAEKISLKNSTIREFQEHQFPQVDSIQYDAWRKREWNNASLLSVSLYSPDFAKFERALRCLEPITAGKFIESLKAEEKARGDAERGLEHLCLLVSQVKKES